jgi:acetyl esterase/lipase
MPKRRNQERSTTSHTHDDGLFAKGKNTGAAVIVFPGGGYFMLAIDIEGTEVCDWLTSNGITCVLLKYRVPNTGPHWDERCKCQMNAKAPMALEDAQRTVGLVRLHPAEYHINPHNVGVLGFSAGGHLVTDISTHFDKRLYPTVDAAERKLPPGFRGGPLSGASLAFLLQEI